jgi:hypothetical protein
MRDHRELFLIMSNYSNIYIIDKYLSKYNSKLK